AAQAAEAAHRQAREDVDAARGPLTAAARTVQRLETEAKTIRKLLAVESKTLWPPVTDAINVAEGYEKALGAALGDDLDAPVGSPPRRTRPAARARERTCDGPQRGRGQAAQPRGS